MNRTKLLLLMAGASTLAVAIGCLAGWPWLTFVASVVGLCSGGFALGHSRSSRPATLREQVADAVVGPREWSETEELVEEMLSQGRFALLLRPQVIGNLTFSQKKKAEATLHERMAAVPPGELLPGIAEDDLAQEIGPAFEQGLVPTILHVDEFLLDRYPITNRQFQEFVDAGGYKQMALWDPQVWAAIGGFLDTTGQLAPRFWSNACYPANKGDHPVVGVCWFEAAAYARWVGKRLPSEAEWEKAASWPIPMPNAGPLQRRYPWGDAMTPDRANLWSAERDGTVAVDEYSDGCSAGGVHQLIGNVWEWTADDFNDPRLLLTFPMKSIRGGAFDTYFDHQATCQYRSAESPVGRKHNIGFRCALSACDLRSTTIPGGDAGQHQETAYSEPTDEVCRP